MSLEEIVKKILTDQFNDWVELGEDDEEELELYEAVDAHEYAKARMQELANDLVEYYNWNIDQDLVADYSKQEVLEEFKHQLILLGY